MKALKIIRSILVISALTAFISLGYNIHFPLGVLITVVFVGIAYSEIKTLRNSIEFPDPFICGTCNMTINRKSDIRICVEGERAKNFCTEDCFRSYLDENFGTNDKSKD